MAPFLKRNNPKTIRERSSIQKGRARDRRRYPLACLVVASYFSLNLVSSAFDVSIKSPAFMGTLFLLAAYLLFSRLRRDFFERSLLMLASTFFCLAVVDSAIRPVLRDRLYYRPDDRFLEKWSRCRELHRYMPSVSYEGRTFGDFAAVHGEISLREYRRVAFTTDAFGFRNDPVDNPSMPYDVIMLGDSFVAGVGTSQEHIVSNQLKRHWGFHTYNMGIQATNPWGQYLNFIGEYPRLQIGSATRVVWVLYSGNDLDEPYGSFDLDQIRPPGDWRKGYVRWRSFRGRSPTARLLKMFNHSSAPLVAFKTWEGKPVSFFKSALHSEPRSKIDIENHRNYSALRESLTRMIAFTKEKGLRLDIVVAPPKEEIYRWFIRDEAAGSTPPAPSAFYLAIRGICASENVAVHDMKPYLINASRTLYESRQKWLWWRDDTHWNEEGHYFAASMIATDVLGRSSGVSDDR